MEIESDVSHPDKGCSNCFQCNGTDTSDRGLQLDYVSTLIRNFHMLPVMECIVTLVCSQQCVVAGECGLKHSGAEYVLTSMPIEAMPKGMAESRAA